MNFSNPELLAGWPVDREIAVSSVMFRKNNNYFLGILDKAFKKEFKNLPIPLNNEDIRNIAKILVDKANKYGGKDNISVMIIDL